MPDNSRRQFLSLLSAGFAASALPGWATTPPLPARKIGVALLGLGGYSSNLLAPALEHTRYCELRGIVTGSQEKIPRWQARYAIPDTNVYSYDDMHRIADNPDIDVVYVVVPTGLHMHYAVKAANAGKHVWCEKPMAMNTSECQAIIEACKKNGVKLSVGYRMQHEPNTQLMAGYTKNQPFGPIKAVSSFAGYGGNGLPANNWRMKKNMGGGALYDMGVYPINGARFITGLEPVAVTGRHEKTHADIFTEVDETTYFTLEFANGLVADCGTSVVKSFNRLRVDCEDGWYELSPMQSYSGVTATNSNGQRFGAISGMQQTLQMDNDALALLGQGPIRVPGEEGMKDIQLVNAIFQSASSGQKVTL
ncbi:gfo/Idh/MocA family oxidoreductase [Alteromonas aestuariivivens]|uniref:Gfo/Idh/MocA family oxidoreductase n=1 Tax=Alteromonas aestuariivivens TaxID=1938339 RepID=A0A3D8M582_9ALTE|nr:Gfo/Idh/MocA family oxidoreductase [Alteromonas aestuariivivens]RDV24897.1 gfo/Idh/MocA family oxidoreductase [Alteromonas aestuariivivens]